MNAMEHVMSDPACSDPIANSTGPNGDAAAPAAPTDPADAHLPHVEAPSLSPERPQAPIAEAAAAEPTDSRGAGNAANTVTAPDPTGPAGTALVLAHPQPKAEAAAAPPNKPQRSWPSFRSLAAMLAGAAVLGGLAGALAAAGISSFMDQASSTPPYYAAVAEALGRLDRELTQLKAGIDASAKTTELANITERLDRAEKAQAEAGTRLARATEGLDRLERRIGTPTASPGDVTGSISDPRSTAPGPAISGDGRRTLPPGAGGAAGVAGVGNATLPILDGWVVRDVYRGAALIQGRAGILQVVPGEVLPGLGRIESVSRHDGRWEVVTTRGLIVSR
jgi:hypothetical protein